MYSVSAISSMTRIGMEKDQCFCVWEARDLLSLGECVSGRVRIGQCFNDVF